YPRDLLLFFADRASTELYTLSLHDALPISLLSDLALMTIGGRLKARGNLSGRFADVLSWLVMGMATLRRFEAEAGAGRTCRWYRSEEHTSELQSRENLVCRLLLEKKKKVYS